MGRGLSPLQKDILKALTEVPRNNWRFPNGSMTTGELSRRCARGIGAEEATSRALRRLRERGLVLGGWSGLRPSQIRNARGSFDEGRNTPLGTRASGRELVADGFTPHLTPE